MAMRLPYPRRQRGWVGLVVILIALLIVAVMAQKALKTYGLVPGAEETRRADAPAPGEATTAPATPANAMQRARGLEQQVQRDAQDQAKRIDAQTQ